MAPVTGTPQFCRGQPELFPLPMLELETACNLPLSRGCRQRIGRRRAVIERTNDAISSLNWLSGSSARDVAQRHVSPAQAAAITRIQRAVEDSAPTEPLLPPHEAARTLLRTQAGYGLDDTTVAPFQDGKVSLPSSAVSCPRAVDLLGGRARTSLENFETEILRSDADVWQHDALEGRVEPYMDVVLSKNKKMYLNFVKDLISRGVVRWCRFAKERTTLFFVRKKDGRLRLVADARRSNRRFIDPPGVRMATAESFANLEVADDECVCTSALWT